MASDLNIVALVGRLTRDPQLTMSQTGMAILRFSIAVNRRRKNADGTWGDEANFFDCVYFGKSAESVSQFLGKGRQVAIQGELRQDSWKTDDGQTRSRVEIFVNNLNLIGSGQQRDGQQSGYGQSRSNGGYNQQNQGGYGAPQGNSQYQGGGNNQYQNSGSWQGNAGYSRGNGNFQQASQPAPVESQMAGGPEDFTDDNIPF